MEHTFHGSIKSRTCDESKLRKLSILKPPKARLPLQEVNLGVQYCEDDSSFAADEDILSRKRRVSFAGVNRIKEFHSKAESLHIIHTPAYEEAFSTSSESSVASVEKSENRGRVMESQSIEMRRSSYNTKVTVGAEGNDQCDMSIQNDYVEMKCSTNSSDWNSSQCGPYYNGVAMFVNQANTGMSTNSRDYPILDTNNTVGSGAPSHQSWADLMKSMQDGDSPEHRHSNRNGNVVTGSRDMSRQSCEVNDRDEFLNHMPLKSQQIYSKPVESELKQDNRRPLGIIEVPKNNNFNTDISGVVHLDYTDVNQPNTQNIYTESCAPTECQPPPKKLFNDFFEYNYNPNVGRNHSGPKMLFKTNSEPEGDNDADIISDKWLASVVQSLISPDINSEGLSVSPTVPSDKDCGKLVDTVKSTSDKNYKDDVSTRSKRVSGYDVCKGSVGVNISAKDVIGSQSNSACGLKKQCENINRQKYDETMKLTEAFPRNSKGGLTVPFGQAKYSSVNFEPQIVSESLKDDRFQTVGGYFEDGMELTQDLPRKSVVSDKYNQHHKQSDNYSGYNEDKFELTKTIQSKQNAQNNENCNRKAKSENALKSKLGNPLECFDDMDFTEAIPKHPIRSSSDQLKHTTDNYGNPNQKAIHDNRKSIGRNRSGLYDDMEFTEAIPRNPIGSCSDQFEHTTDNYGSSNQKAIHDNRKSIGRNRSGLYDDMEFTEAIPRNPIGSCSDQFEHTTDNYGSSNQKRINDNRKSMGRNKSGLCDDMEFTEAIPRNPIGSCTDQLEHITDNYGSFNQKGIHDNRKSMGRNKSGLYDDMEFTEAIPRNPIGSCNEQLEHITDDYGSSNQKGIHYNRKSMGRNKSGLYDMEFTEAIPRNPIGSCFDQLGHTPDKYGSSCQKAIHNNRKSMGGNKSGLYDDMEFTEAIPRNPIGSCSEQLEHTTDNYGSSCQKAIHNNRKSMGRNKSGLYDDMEFTAAIPRNPIGSCSEQLEHTTDNYGSSCQKAIHNNRKSMGGNKSGLYDDMEFTEAIPRNPIGSCTDQLEHTTDNYGSCNQKGIHDSRKSMGRNKSGLYDDMEFTEAIPRNPIGSCSEQLEHTTDNYGSSCQKAIHNNRKSMGGNKSGLYDDMEFTEAIPRNPIGSCSDQLKHTTDNYGSSNQKGIHDNRKSMGRNRSGLYDDMEFTEAIPRNPIGICNEQLEHITDNYGSSNQKGIHNNRKSMVRNRSGLYDDMEFTEAIPRNPIGSCSEQLEHTTDNYGSSNQKPIHNNRKSMGRNKSGLYDDMEFTEAIPRNPIGSCFDQLGHTPDKYGSSCQKAIHNNRKSMGRNKCGLYDDMEFTEAIPRNPIGSSSEQLEHTTDNYGSSNQKPIHNNRKSMGRNKSGLYDDMEFTEAIPRNPIGSCFDQLGHTPDKYGSSCQKAIHSNRKSMGRNKSGLYDDMEFTEAIPRNPIGSCSEQLEHTTDNYGSSCQKAIHNNRKSMGRNKSGLYDDMEFTEAIPRNPIGSCSEQLEHTTDNYGSSCQKAIHNNRKSMGGNKSGLYDDMEFTEAIPRNPIGNCSDQLGHTTDNYGSSCQKAIHDNRKSMGRNRSGIYDDMEFTEAIPRNPIGNCSEQLEHTTDNYGSSNQKAIHNNRKSTGRDMSGYDDMEFTEDIPRNPKTQGIGQIKGLLLCDENFDSRAQSEYVKPHNPRVDHIDNGKLPETISENPLTQSAYESKQLMPSDENFDPKGTCEYPKPPKSLFQYEDNRELTEPIPRNPTNSEIDQSNQSMHNDENVYSISPHEYLQPCKLQGGYAKSVEFSSCVQQKQDTKNVESINQREIYVNATHFKSMDGNICGYYNKNLEFNGAVPSCFKQKQNTEHGENRNKKAISESAKHRKSMGGNSGYYDNMELTEAIPRNPVTHGADGPNYSMYNGNDGNIDSRSGCVNDDNQPKQNCDNSLVINENLKHQQPMGNNISGYYDNMEFSEAIPRNPISSCSDKQKQTTQHCESTKQWGIHENTKHRKSMGGNIACYDNESMELTEDIPRNSVTQDMDNNFPQTDGDIESRVTSEDLKLHKPISCYDEEVHLPEVISRNEPQQNSQNCENFGERAIYENAKHRKSMGGNIVCYDNESMELTEDIPRNSVTQDMDNNFPQTDGDIESRVTSEDLKLHKPISCYNEEVHLPEVISRNEPQQNSQNCENFGEGAIYENAKHHKSMGGNIVCYDNESMELTEDIPRNAVTQDMDNNFPQTDGDIESRVTSEDLKLHKPISCYNEEVHLPEVISRNEPQQNSQNCENLGEGAIYENAKYSKSMGENLNGYYVNAELPAASPRHPISSCSDQLECTTDNYGDSNKMAIHDNVKHKSIGQNNREYHDDNGEFNEDIGQNPPTQDIVCLPEMILRNDLHQNSQNCENSDLRPMSRNVKHRKSMGRIVMEKSDDTMEFCDSIPEIQLEQTTQNCENSKQGEILDNVKHRESTSRNISGYDDDDDDDMELTRDDYCPTIEAIDQSKDLLIRHENFDSRKQYEHLQPCETPGDNIDNLESFGDFLRDQNCENINKSVIQENIKHRKSMGGNVCGKYDENVRFAETIPRVQSQQTSLNCENSDQRADHENVVHRKSIGGNLSGYNHSNIELIEVTPKNPITQVVNQSIHKDENFDSAGTNSHLKIDITPEETFSVVNKHAVNRNQSCEFDNAYSSSEDCNKRKQGVGVSNIIIQKGIEIDEEKEVQNNQGSASESGGVITVEHATEETYTIVGHLGVTKTSQSSQQIYSTGQDFRKGEQVGMEIVESKVPKDDEESEESARKSIACTLEEKPCHLSITVKDCEITYVVESRGAIKGNQSTDSVIVYHASEDINKGNEIKEAIKEDIQCNIITVEGEVVREVIREEKVENIERSDPKSVVFALENRFCPSDITVEHTAGEKCTILSHLDVTRTNQSCERTSENPKDEVNREEEFENEEPAQKSVAGSLEKTLPCNTVEHSQKIKLQEDNRNSLNESVANVFRNNAVKKELPNCDIVKSNLNNFELKKFVEKNRIYMKESFGFLNYNPTTWKRPCFKVKPNLQGSFYLVLTFQPGVLEGKSVIENSYFEQNHSVDGLLVDFLSKQMMEKFEADCQALSGRTLDLAGTFIKSLEKEISLARSFRENAALMTVFNPFQIVGNRLNFYIVSVEHLVKFNVSIDLKSWRNITKKDILIEPVVGKIRTKMILDTFAGIPQSNQKLLQFAKFLKDNCQLIIE